jgi:hypothetical protein
MGAAPAPDEASDGRRAHFRFEILLQPIEHVLAVIDRFAA